MTDRETDFMFAASRGRAEKKTSENSQKPERKHRR